MRRVAAAVISAALLVAGCSSSGSATSPTTSASASSAGGGRPADAATTDAVRKAYETGLLAAIGRACVSVVRRPAVAILSTGNEVIAPGEPSRLQRAVRDAEKILPKLGK